jgi:hippurate hydrolase
VPDVTAGPGLIHAAHGHGAVMADLRRQLASDPEYGLSAPRAQARILAALGGLPARVATGDRLSSVVAVVRGAHPGGAVLVRADTDTITGIHAAALVGAAWILAGLRERLSGDVVCVWQPGSAGHGGAQALLDEGVLDAAGRRVDAAYAVRAIPGLPRGVVATRPGPVIAAADRIQVTIGAGPGSIARPVAAACHLAAVLDRIRTQDTAVVVDHVTTDDTTATVVATVHAPHPASRAQAYDIVGRITAGYATAHGLHAAVMPTATRAAVNDPGEADRVIRVVTALYGRARLVEQLAAPAGVVDDVGELLDAVPGAVALMLGALPDDGTLLPSVAALYAGLAVHRLADRRITPATIRHHRGDTSRAGDHHAPVRRTGLQPSPRPGQGTAGTTVPRTGPPPAAGPEDTPRRGPDTYGGPAPGAPRHPGVTADVPAPAALP